MSLSALKRVTIVEDDTFLRVELKDILAGAGFEVTAIDCFDKTLAAIVETAPHLILLDLGLPGLSGYELIRALRGVPDNKVPLSVSISTHIPILVLTARDRLVDELHALNLGADEYLTKPVETSRLLARIHSLLRRSPTKDDSRFLSMGCLQLDPQSFTLYAGDISLRLAPQEGRLLAALIEANGEVVTRQVLHEALWGTSEFIDENALQVTLTRLRKTLHGAGLSDPIQTIRKEGLRLVYQKDNL